MANFKKCSTCPALILPRGKYCGPCSDDARRLQHRELEKRKAAHAKLGKSRTTRQQEVSHYATAK